MTHKCSATCTQGWSPGRRCHCMVCGENFTVVANFDKHRKDGQCLPPESIGMVLNERGIWAKPGEREFPPSVRGTTATAD